MSTLPARAPFETTAALGHLEAEPARVHGGLGESGRGRIDDVPACELPRGQVDRYPDVAVERAGRLPARVVAARLGQDPAAERVDHPGVLGDADELAGRDKAALRVLPAHERLEPCHAARRELYLRLVGDPKLVLVERGAQLRLELPPLHRPRAQRLAEDLVASAAALLRPVHREVGVVDQRIRVHATARR